MGHKAQDNYYDDDYYDDGYERPQKKSGIGTVLVILGVVVIVGVCVLGFLAALILPSLSQAQTKAGKAKCANNLRGIGIACILYSEDRRFFPHMVGLKEEHGQEHISDVYRTLIQGQYLDYPEALVCPISNDYPVLETPLSTAKEAKTWDWESKNASEKWAAQNPSRKSVFDNDCLSYTYRRKLARGHSVRSDTFLAADKWGGKIKGKQSNHPDGYNVLFGDGHTMFFPVSDKETLDNMYQQLRMKSDRNPH